MRGNGKGSEVGQKWKVYPHPLALDTARRPFSPCTAKPPAGWEGRTLAQQRVRAEGIQGLFAIIRAGNFEHKDLQVGSSWQNIQGDPAAHQGLARCWVHASALLDITGPCEDVLKFCTYIVKLGIKNSFMSCLSLN